MSIPFECSCGKKMAAREEFAGRRLRCPECQRIVTIPKEESGPIPASSKATNAPSSRILVQPTLTKSEVAALEVTRPIRNETVPLPNAPNFDSPANLDDLPGISMTVTPILAPKGASPHAPMPAAGPRPGDELTVTQVTQNTEPIAHTESPWIDRSLQQIATPWRPGDEQRFQAGIAPSREWEWPLDWIVPILVVAASVFFAV